VTSKGRQKGDVWVRLKPLPVGLEIQALSCSTNPIVQAQESTRRHRTARERGGQNASRLKSGIGSTQSIWRQARHLQDVANGRPPHPMSGVQDKCGCSPHVLFSVAIRTTRARISTRTSRRPAFLAYVHFGAIN